MARWWRREPDRPIPSVASDRLVRMADDLLAKSTELRSLADEVRRAVEREERERADQ